MEWRRYFFSCAVIHTHTCWVIPGVSYLTGMSHTASISSLPADCLLHIFLALPLKDVINCGRVCKSWRKLLKTKQLVSIKGYQIIMWSSSKMLSHLSSNFAYNFKYYMVKRGNMAHYIYSIHTFLFIDWLKVHHVIKNKLTMNCRNYLKAINSFLKL